VPKKGKILKEKIPIFRQKLNIFHPKKAGHFLVRARKVIVLGGNRTHHHHQGHEANRKKKLKKKDFEKN